ncbi:lytic transglycosylase domain-containing protein [Belliella sp. R4-6]|uniref:Lytic transglycosylase domain-containing protein n=1 Tax=Belliella alkalica TaxID=1730871 RepID=A0ABS9VDT2_9BACT|nr:lytic transglycosylase domain-containing protein [Belliella alkalica]MCH7414599.1 lytic transglycosylase domain-containing protein [Belliella alkalica]
MKNYHLISIYGLIAVLFGLVFLYSAEKDQADLPYEEVTINQASGEEINIKIPDTRAKLFEIPKAISFAGEEVPLEIDDVKERFEREIYVNAYWQSNMILLMKRSGKYIPTIEKILKEQNIPDDFKYLAMAESGLLNVVSPAGARGFWQFMPATAKEYNLEVSNDVDERYHLEKATVAACKYLKSAYARFGSWTSVAASYNMGISGLSKRKSEQKQVNYYDLLLNDETSRYIFRLLAFKEIFENPDKYGFKLKEEDYYTLPISRELVVKQDIDDLATWAIKHNSSYKILKIQNPWLRTNKLKIPKGKEYVIKLPSSE